MCAFLYLHRITQCTGSSRNNRDLLYWSRICLLCRYKGMTDLMISHGPFFLICQNRILLLVTGNDDFNALFQIRLCRIGSAITHRAQRSLIYNIRQLRSGCPGRHSGNLVKIHIIRYLDLLRMYLKNCLSAA